MYLPQCVKGDSILYDCGHKWLFAEGQRGIDGQNGVTVILPISGLGSARVHNAENCIFGLNQNPPVSAYKST